jgi:hypothetical protein
MAVTTFCSSNYLVLLKEEDRSDLDMIREKDVERLRVRFRKWHHETRRALLRIKASFWHALSCLAERITLKRVLVRDN